MPIYEYKCQRCGRIIEVIQRLNDARQQACEECGNNSMERLISIPVVHRPRPPQPVTAFPGVDRRKVIDLTLPPSFRAGVLVEAPESDAT